MRIGIGSPTGLFTTVRIAAVVVEVVSASLIEVVRGELLTRSWIDVIAIIRLRFVGTVMTRTLASPPVVPDINRIGHLEVIGWLAG